MKFRINSTKQSFSLGWIFATNLPILLL